MSNTMEIVSNESGNSVPPEFFANRLGLDIPWLHEMQAEARETYTKLLPPRRTEEQWRFAKLDRIREIERFTPASPATIPSDLIAKSHRFSEVSGRIVFLDDTLAGDVELDPEVAAQGVIFTSLATALVEHEELVRKYFMKARPELGSEKFEALHIALLKAGVFLYVPDDVKLNKPFIAYHYNEASGKIITPHTLFVLGDNADAELFEFQESLRDEVDGLVIANAHLHAGDDAFLHHTILQNWSEKTLSFQLNTSNAQGKTRTKSTVINLGSCQARQEIHGRIFGDESNVELYALNVPHQDQEFDQRTLQTHIAPDSRSDLLFKNTLLDKSRTIFSGLIIVEEDAQKTDAYQTNNNLMLSEDAESNSLPGLEIKANDVKCSHGATTGRVDESELFYFLARGISREKAQELMIFGFCEEILEKLDNEELAEYVRESVQRKLSS